MVHARMVYTYHLTVERKYRWKETYQDGYHGNELHKLKKYSAVEFYYYVSGHVRSLNSDYSCVTFGSFNLCSASIGYNEQVDLDVI